MKAKLVKESLNTGKTSSNGDLFLESLWRHFSSGNKEFDLIIEDMKPDRCHIPGKTVYNIEWRLSPKKANWTEVPREPRGDMDPESWGDKPDWRENEMGR